ncbi:hypothetical protein THAOC_03558, partial [Thalassiosira oceanica]
MPYPVLSLGLLWALLVQHCEAGKCGTPLYGPCLGVFDPRYNDSVSNNLVDQDPFWEDYTGYWIGTNENFAPDGTPRPPSFYDTRTKQGIPYATDVPFLTFANRSVDGTRYYHHIAIVYNPANEEFCNQKLEGNQANVIGNGTCGINGHVAAVDVLGTSTYKKDSSVEIFWWTNGQGRGPALLNTSFAKPGEDGISWHMQYKQRRVTEEEWLQELEQAYGSSNVLEEDRLTIPLEGPCLRTWDCPIDEATWCAAGDPNTQSCPNNVSPYQEPEAPMRTGAVVGFSILGIVAAAAIG